MSFAHSPNFAPSRPGTPPITHRSSTPYEPQRSDSHDSVDSSSSSSSSSRRSRFSQPTNTLIITPLPAPFFEPLILDALRQHFASFSTTYIHTSPPSTSPIRRSPSPNASNHFEGSLYSWVPLKSLKRAIVVFHNPDDAERARQASDRYYFPPTPSTPEITLRVFRGVHTMLVPAQLTGPPDRFYDVDSDDESAIFESPFHLRPPVPEKNFLISPPGSPPVGWEQTREEPPNEVALAEDLQRALERLRVQRELESREADGAGAYGELSENEDGILLIPESEAGVSVRVQNWSHRRRVTVTRGSEAWDALDEELSDGEWELPSHVPPVCFPASGSWNKGFKPAPASMPPIIHPPTMNGSGFGGGLMSPSGNIRIQPTARPPPPPGA